MPGGVKLYSVRNDYLNSSSMRINSESGQGVDVDEVIFLSKALSV